MSISQLETFGAHSKQDTLIDRVDCKITHAEGDSAYEISEDGNSISFRYSTCLTISYVVGTFVYDSTTKAEKRQRSLGLVISMVLSKAKLDGRLKEDRLFDRWEPSKPVIALNIEKTKWFNAIVIDELPGLLLPDEIKTNEILAQQAWQHIGKRPIFDIIVLVSRILAEAGIIIDKEVAE